MARWFRMVSTRSAWLGLVLHVLIYDQTNAPRDVIRSAQEAATRIFRRLDIDVAWVEASQRTVPASTYVIRLVPGAAAASGAALGFAVPGSHVASVLYPRVERLAGSTGHDDVAVVLGHVMAHELGHLLLRDSSHSVSGLMQPEFSLLRAQQGGLYFSGQQAQTIRAALSASN